MSQSTLLTDLKARVGETLMTSDWLEVDQARVNAFAEATGDFQWIHVDVERARRESPYGGPIAHGYLTLSLYPFLRNLVNEDNPAYPGITNIINYGLNKLRFPNAVRVGDRVRGHFKLIEVSEITGGLQVVELFTAEVDGHEKPACIAEGIFRLYF